MFTLLDLCVSSLRRGHANLLCIVPILTDDPRRESNMTEYNNGWNEHGCRCVWGKICNGTLRRTVSQYILNAMGGELFTYSWEPRSSRKNSGSHIDASLSRQPLVKGERLVRYEVNAVILRADTIFERVNLYIFIMVFDTTIYIYIYTHAFLYPFEYFDAGQLSWDI